MANGHQQAAIWSYSLPAIQIYVELIRAREQQELYALTVAVRHSQGTDQKVFREFLTSLEGDD